MWDYDSLLAKTQVYLQRAEDHPHANDDEFALWMLLGLEFLLRAPLARVHPSLLAAPEGNSLLHAAGVTTVGDPKSVASHTVIDRLAHVVPSFNGDRQSDARQLLALRNNELHTGSAALASLRTEVWLPRFLRVAEVLCTHLELKIEDLIGEEIASLGRTLADEEDKRLCSEVNKRIGSAKVFFDGLQSSDVAARGRASELPPDLTAETVQCPACGQDALLALDAVRSTNEQLIDDEFVRDVILVATRLTCKVCGLVLQGTAELKCAGLPQQLTRARRESVYDRLVGDYMDYDYGND